MDFSPTDREEIKRIAAKMIVDEIRQSAGGDLKGIVVLPLTSVGPMTGYSVKQLKNRLPITKMGPNKDGVTLRALETHIEGNTTAPAA